MSEKFVTVGIGTNRTILAHQLLDLIESKGPLDRNTTAALIDEIYGILIEITGRPTMAEKHPELIDKAVQFVNPKLELEEF